MIDLTDARAMHELLAKAATDAAIRQYRYVLQAQADEWETAIGFFDEAEGEGVIELAGAVVAPMRIAHASPMGGLEWRRVLRRTQGPGCSLQIDNPDGNWNLYREFFSAASPVVVRL